MTEKFNESIKFVVKHYRPDAFLPVMRFVHVGVRYRRSTVAAAVISGILMVSACVYVLVSKTDSIPQSDTLVSPAQVESPQAVVPELEVKNIEFTDAPLSEVVNAIKVIYNVEINGLDPESKVRLTLRYEGTAKDLVETINELEGTNLTIAE